MKGDKGKEGNWVLISLGKLLICDLGVSLL